ncbi:MAG: RNA polymerase sigma factor [Acidimicrobiia bacterium]
MQRWRRAQRLTGGERLTDREIYEQLRGPLMRFASSLVGPDEAADLVSEVMVATLRRRSLASLDNPGAYLMKAVLNRSRSRGRRLANQRKVEETNGVAAEVPDHAEELVLPDLAGTVARLPVQQRAAIYLVYWEGLEPTEAAAVIGVQPGTLRRYLHLARNQLRRHLDG